MKIYKTTGIILSSKNIGEADILCNILTKDSGKGQFIFKGLRKSKRRSITASEPGSFTTFQYYFRENKETSIISDFSVEKHHSEIRKNLDKIYHLYLLIETTDKTIGFHENNILYYNLLSSAVKNLSKTQYPVHLSAVYLLHLLKLHGLLVISQQCKKCGNTTYRGFTLDSADLGTICLECTRNGYILPEEVMSFIAEALAIKFDDINAELFADNAIQDLIFNLVLFIENYFSIKINSKEFVLRKI